MIQDKMTQQMCELADLLPTMDEGELYDTLTGAAENFTDYTLHTKRPIERQGSTDAFASALRAQRRDAAEALWLAAHAELDSRR